MNIHSRLGIALFRYRGKIAAVISRRLGSGTGQAVFAAASPRWN